MKKTISIVCLIALLLGLFGCGKQESASEAYAASEAASIEVTTTLTGEYVIPDSWSEVSLVDGTWGYVTTGVELEGNTDYTMDDGYLTARTVEDGGNVLLRLTLDGTEVNRISVPRPDMPEEDDWSIGFFCFGEDSVWFTENRYTLIDAETGEMSASYTLKKYSFTGEELVSLELGEDYGINEENFLCNLALTPEGDPMILTLTQMLFCDEMGNIVATYESEDVPGLDFVRDQAGRIYCSNFFDNTLYTMDWENHTLGSPVMELGGNESLYPGGAGYDLLMCGETTLKGVSFEKGTITEILNWGACDLAGMVGSVAYLDEENILITAYDLLLGTSQALKLTRVPADQIPEKTVVTMAIPMHPNTAEWGGTWADCLDEMVATQMASFNRSSDTYRVEVVTFSTAEELQLMMLSEDAPDIISWSKALEVMPSLELYAKKGYLADLGALIEEEPELSLNDFIPSVVELATERTSGLYAMPVQFYLITLLGDTEYVGTETGWSIGDMLAVAEGLPEDKNLWNYVIQTEALSSFLSGGGNQFVDMVNMTCDFQNQEFYDLLRLCRDYFPASPEEEAYMNPTGDGMLTGEGTLGRMGQFASDILRNLEASGQTIIGYPGDPGNGFTMIFTDEFSICALGDQQQGAWEFLRTLYTYDYQYAAGRAWSSVREDVFNAREDWYLEVNGSCTEEESLAARELVYGVKSLRNYTNPVNAIVVEEAAAYFSGDKSAEDVAAIIENRVKIYLSEQS